MTTFLRRKDKIDDDYNEDENISYAGNIDKNVIMSIFDIDISKVDENVTNICVNNFAF